MRPGRIESRVIPAPTRLRTLTGHLNFKQLSDSSPEQVERLLRGGEGVPAGLRREDEPEPELSDEEIFWDL